MLWILLIIDLIDLLMISYAWIELILCFYDDPPWTQGFQVMSIYVGLDYEREIYEIKHVLVKFMYMFYRMLWDWSINDVVIVGLLKGISHMHM